MRGAISTHGLVVAGAVCLAGICVAAGCATRASLVPRCTDPFLQRLVGEWDTVRTMDDKVVASVMHAEPVLGGAFVQLHLRCLAPDDPYEAVVLVGRADDRGGYVAHWCDTFGAAYSEVGRGTLADSAVEFRFNYPSGPFFNTWRYDPAQDAWTFTGESQNAGGSRTLFAREVIRRRRAR